MFNKDKNKPQKDPQNIEMILDDALSKNNNKIIFERLAEI